MMHPEQFEEIMREVLSETRENQPGTGPRFVLPITPFAATDFDDRDIEVVGITGTEDDNENLNFVVMVEIENGEIIPSLREGVWRKTAVIAALQFEEFNRLAIRTRGFKKGTRK